MSVIIAVVLGDQSEVEKHLAEGKRLLQEGQLSDALYHYAAAVGEFQCTLGAVYTCLYIRMY